MKNILLNIYKKKLKYISLPLLLLASSPILFGQSDKSLTEATFHINTIKSHIRFLASNELRGRSMPSAELNIAARYLAANFMRYEVQPAPSLDGFLQKVSLNNQPNSGTLTIQDLTLHLNKDFIVVNAVNTNISGALEFVGRGTKEEFEKKDLKGKIAVTWAGYEGESNPQNWYIAGGDKRQLATDNGALGLIELYGSQRLPWKFLVRRMGRSQLSVKEVSTDLPHIWLSTSDERILSLIKSSPPTIGSLEIELSKSSAPDTYNVIGLVEGTDPVLKKEYILYSAHYDHLGIGRANERGDTIYNGARDNAVGVVTVLSTAENIAKYPTKRSALFVLFTGEEKGLLGSKWFAQHTPIPLNQIVYCLNSDNAGYNDTSIATIVGLTRTTAQAHIEKACYAFGLKATEDPAPAQNLFDRSDNVTFAKKGIPAPTFSMGFRAFDTALNKYYHQPSDHSDNLDYEYLSKFFKSYTYSCRLIANTNSHLFWNEGDKYYPAGINLYKK